MTDRNSKKLARLEVSQLEVPKNRSNLEGLNSLRGIAAASIVVFHVLGIHGLKIPASLSFINSYFGLGVPLFFVISAFSLFLSTSSRVGGDGWLSAYAIRRFMRIAPLFYSIAVFYVIYIPIQFGSYISPAIFIGTISFLFNLMPGQHESMIWAGWTIGVEMLFYAVVPYLLIFTKNIYTSVVLLVGAVIISSVFFKFYQSGGYPPGYAYMSFMGSLGVFFFGIFGYFLYKNLVNNKNSTAIGYTLLVVAVIIMILIALKEQTLIPYVGNRSNIWGFAFTLLVVSQCLAPISVITNPIFSYMGKLSFSLYLCHPPLVYVLKPAYLYFYSMFSDGLAFCISALLTLAILIPLARLVNVLIEEPGIRLGERIIRAKIGRDHFFVEKQPISR